MTNKSSQDIKALVKQLNIKFKDNSLLLKAITHRSYLNEHRYQDLEHNERLEFLGDAVLELVVTEYLFNHFQEKPEGELTNLRAALVRGENLSKIGQELKIDQYMRLSRGEANSGSRRSRNYITANAVEAVIGAIYLDQGYTVAQKFILKNIIKELPVIIKDQLFKDPKSLFQEKAQEVLGVTPNYQLISQKGPDHNKYFIVGAYLDDKLISKGSGKSKQEAQQIAAQKALQKKKWTQE
ncbi:MAG: ribonuclease III [Candidatus Moranbacteria bacterium]|nr:ribonuclease III [Candidatus Moranbacteria bacterium]